MSKLINSHVELIYTKSPEYSATSAYYVEGYILVFRTSLKKRIIVHYTYDYNHWLDCKASFLLCTSDNSEVWYFKTPNRYSYNSCSFAICCKVNHDEYWDNNREMNYNLKWYFPTKILQNCCVILDRAFKAYNNMFYGKILVKNLGYYKQIKVRYSIDNWKTYNEIDAEYSNELPNNLEVWKFNTNVAFEGQIRFYIYLEANDNIYYDKNFDRYYII